jgi:hypothetical protein
MLQAIHPEIYCLQLHIIWLDFCERFLMGAGTRNRIGIAIEIRSWKRFHAMLDMSTTSPHDLTILLDLIVRRVCG